MNSSRRGIHFWMLNQPMSGLMFQAVLIFSALIAGALMPTRPSAAAVPKYPITVALGSQASNFASIERRVWRQVNQQRQRYGLRPLRRNPKLNQVARHYSWQMAAYNFYRHRGLRGETPRQRVVGNGIRAGLVGENLMKLSQKPYPAMVTVQSWMNSSGHRRNILLPQMTETGIGVWQRGSTYFVTQLYMQPMH